MSLLAPVDQLGKFFVSRSQLGTALRKKLTRVRRTREQKRELIKDYRPLTGINKVKFRLDAGPMTLLRLFDSVPWNSFSEILHEYQGSVVGPRARPNGVMERLRRSREIADVSGFFH